MGTEFTVRMDRDKRLTVARDGRTLLTADAGSLTSYEAYIGAEIVKSFSQGAAGELSIIPGTATDERIPELCIRSSKDGRSPALLLLHGFGSSKEKMIRYGVHCALNGFYTVMIDAPYHGSRTGNTSPMFDIAADAEKGWRNRLDLIGEYLREALSTLQDISSRPLVDASRIATAGISMGASVAMLAAARNDAVKAALAFVPILDYESIAGTIELRHDDREIVHALDPLYACRKMPAAVGLFCGSVDTVAGTGAKVLISVLTESPQSDTARHVYREYHGVGHEVSPLMLADGIAWMMRFV